MIEINCVPNSVKQITPASLACVQRCGLPSGTPNVQLASEVLLIVHCGLLTHTLPVPGPNTAATRSATAPIVEMV